ncbi:MAG: HEAT repeat domain-containing protein, partial [Cyanobacteriota bacterium]
AITDNQREEIRQEDIRREVSDALVEIGAPAVESLVVLSRNADKDLYKLTVDALMAIGKPAVEPLIVALNKDENQSARHTLAKVLGEIGDARAVGPLVTLLEELEERDSYLRETVVEALGKLGSGLAFETLIDSLKRENVPTIKKTTIKALGLLGDMRAATTLKQLLSDWYLASDAADALQKLGWKPKNIQEKATFLVAKNQWDECVEMGSSAVEPLIKALERPFTREEVADTLGKISDARAVDPLTKFIWDIDTIECNLFSAIANALVKIGDERAVRSLISARHSAHHLKRELIQWDAEKALVEFYHRDNTSKEVKNEILELKPVHSLKIF